MGEATFICVSLLRRFGLRSRNERPAGSQPACAVRMDPYPPHYRMAFAFSTFLYPQRYRLTLRLAFLMTGTLRAYHVPLE